MHNNIIYVYVFSKRYIWLTSISIYLSIYYSLSPSQNIVYTAQSTAHNKYNNMVIVNVNVEMAH